MRKRGERNTVTRLVSCVGLIPKCMAITRLFLPGMRVREAWFILLIVTTSCTRTGVVRTIHGDDSFTVHRIPQYGIAFSAPHTWDIVLERELRDGDAVISYSSRVVSSVYEGFEGGHHTVNSAVFLLSLGKIESLSRVREVSLLGEVRVCTPMEIIRLQETPPEYEKIRMRVFPIAGIGHFGIMVKTISPEDEHVRFGDAFFERISQSVVINGIPQVPSESRPTE